jgi:hypothetical protein
LLPVGRGAWRASGILRQKAGERGRGEEERWSRSRRLETTAPRVPEETRGWFLGAFASSRFIAAFAVLGAFLSTAALCIYGTFVVIATI